MADANRAYLADDQERLRAIIAEWESSPEAVPGEGSGPELVRVIRKIAQVESRLSSIAAAIAKLRASELYRLKQKADKARSEGHDLLGQMAARLDSQIAEDRERLTQLVGARR